MSVVLHSTPVVGLPALTGWAQVVHNHSGHLVCSYAVNGPNAHNLGRDLADLITAAELPDAVSLHQLILDLLARTRKAGSSLEFAAILQADGQLVVGAHQGQILYRRAGATRVLLQAEAEPQLREGKLVPDTTLIALTHQAQAHSELITQQLTQGWDVDTIVTSLLPMLHEQADSALSALAFVSVKETRPATPQPEPAPRFEPLDQKDRSASLPNPPLAASRRLPFEVVTPASPALDQPPFKTALSWLGKLAQNIGRQTITFLRQTSQQLTKAWQLASPKQKQRTVILGVMIISGLIIAIGLAAWRLRVNHQKATQLQTQAKPAQAATDQTKPQELPVFFDLRLTEPNFLANRVIVSGTTAYFADLERKQLIQLDLSKKQSAVLQLSNLDKLTDVSLSEKYLYLLGGGLKRWNLSPDATTQTPSNLENLKPEGDSDRDATFFNSFGSYLYVLNPTKRNIFRFSVDKQGKVSDPVGWLINKKGLDFPQLTSLAIDGDVWLTSKTGQIFKFTQGAPVEWQLTGVKTPPDSPIYIVTDADLTKLYVLEPNRHRLLVVDKNGQFVKEITSPTLAAVTSFGVSESLGKAFAASGSVVYEIGL